VPVSEWTFSRSTVGLIAGALLAFLLPVRYESTTQLMPPDTQSASGAAMLAALSARTGGAIEGVSTDLLGLKSSGALFIGILGSRTVEQRLVDKFDFAKSLQAAPVGRCAPRPCRKHKNLGRPP